VAQNDPINPIENHTYYNISLNEAREDIEEIEKLRAELLKTINSSSMQITTSASKAENSTVSNITGGTYTYLTSGTGINTIGTGPNYQLMGTSTSTNLQFNPCLSGHSLTEDTIEYADGLLVGFCEHCSTRVELKKIPGGISMFRVKALLGGVMGLEEDTEELNLGDLLGVFEELNRDLDEEERAMRQKRKMIDLATQVLNNKVTDRGKTDA